MNKGVLLVNLGSPDSPSVADVRRYLREFLMDGRVLDVNWLVRFCIVHFAILPFRPKQSAEAYQKIWTPAGSPLVVTSRNVQAKLQQRVPVPVELAMRYQNPSIPEAVRNLAQKGVDEVLLIPLFPHYAMSSFETAVERVKEVAAALAPQMRVQVQPPFFEEPDYIAALVGSAQEYLQAGHTTICCSASTACRSGTCASPIPPGAIAWRRRTAARPPARPTPPATGRSVSRPWPPSSSRPGVPAGKYSIAFQSRLGRDPWLKPYTDYELPRLAQSGVKKLLVMCPAFVSDCLETLEEIGLRGRETFLEAGGKELALIPCLNEHPLWLEALEKMVRRFMAPEQGQAGEKAFEAAGRARR